MSRILFIAAHVDDAEISCGGTIAKLIEGHNQVAVMTMSCTYSGICLSDEWYKSMGVLGVSKSVRRDYVTRRFKEDRQNILQELIDIGNFSYFDTVFVHDHQDVHQDHEMLYHETLRAFKTQNIFTYKCPFNSLNLDENYFVHLEERHVEKKIEAIACYKSQAHRSYMNPEFIRAQSITRGIQAGTKYAEAFRVVRLNG